MRPFLTGPGRHRATAVHAWLQAPNARLVPIQQIRSPRRRRIEQIVVLAERERSHLIEERLLARMHVRRIEAAEAEAAVFHRDAERQNRDILDSYCKTIQYVPVSDRFRP